MSYHVLSCPIVSYHVLSCPKRPPFFLFRVKNEMHPSPFSLELIEILIPALFHVKTNDRFTAL